MALSLTQPPWEVPFTPFDRTKIVLIANSSVTWSYPMCVYYCEARGIPTTNIFSVAMGGGPTAVPTAWLGDRATYNTQVTQPLRTLLQRVKAVGIIIGPGCPVTLRYENEAGVLDKYIPFEQLLSVTLRFPDVYLTSFFGVISGGVQILAWRIQFPGNYFNLLGTPGSVWGASQFAFDLITLGPGQTDVEDLILIPGVGLSLSLPTSGASYLDAQSVRHTTLHAAGNLYDTFLMPTLPVGKLGYYAYGGGIPGMGPPSLETEAEVKRIIDDVTLLERFQSRAKALAKPMIFNLFSSQMLYSEGWAYQYYLAKLWGINAKYAYMTGGSAASEVYAPIAGSAYSQADLDAGNVEEEIYGMFGILPNYYPAPATQYAPPYTESWFPQKGAIVLATLSNGFQYALNALLAGGASGYTDSIHITTAHVYAHLNVWRNLVQGMCLLQAHAYGGNYGNVPCGDPLWAPYADSSPSKVKFNQQYNSQQNEIFSLRGGDRISLLNDTELNCRRVYVGSSGNVKVDLANGSTLTFSDVPAGSLLPVSVTKIYSTANGTTASNLIALY